MTVRYIWVPVTDISAQSEYNRSLVRSEVNKTNVFVHEERAPLGRVVMESATGAPGELGAWNMHDHKWVVQSCGSAVKFANLLICLLIFISTVTKEGNRARESSKTGLYIRSIYRCECWTAPMEVQVQPAVNTLRFNTSPTAGPVIGEQSLIQQSNYTSGRVSNGCTVFLHCYQILRRTALSGADFHQGRMLHLGLSQSVCHSTHPEAATHPHTVTLPPPCSYFGKLC